MRRSHIVINAVALLLVCSGIYGSLYSILLIWNKEDPNQVGQGFQTRTVHTADQIVQVVLITQEDRLAGAVTLINSIVSNTKQPVHFSIITDNSSVDHLWEWIENSQLSSISYQVTGLTRDWMSKYIEILKDETKALSYARLLFTKVFPNLRNRVIFLDDDIVVQGDINELFHASISPGHVGAFSSDCDAGAEMNKVQGSQYGNLIYIHKAPLKALHLNSSACTFSLGVCLLDIKQWELQNISQNAIHWIRNNKKTKLYKGEGPLSPLLIALYKKISFLDSSWHVRNLGLRVGSHIEESALAEAKLLHWNGVHKPWSKNIAGNSAFWDAYYVPDPRHKYTNPHKNTS